MKYIVQPGDSLYLLAGRFETSVEDLMAANNLPYPEGIYPGQLLFIPLPARPMPAMSMSANPIVEETEYFVQPDESLYDIAVKQNVPLRELIQLNNITIPYIVYNGQSLKLPSAVKP